MASKRRPGDAIATIPGSLITYLHTGAAYGAFLGALFLGLALHYHKIVENEHFGYPVEWFPSVSATIGDRYPERAVFQFFIAACSGPRFLLVALFYCMTRATGGARAKWVAGVGVFRTLTCGGWTYVTSTDDHDWHDIFMISYLVATLPWTLGCLSLSPIGNGRTIWWRKWLAGSFFGMIVPLVYFFIQHKVHRVPGAYTTYAFFEWSLVLLDVAFDAVTAIDFAGLELVVKDVGGVSRGDGSPQDAVLQKLKDKPVAQTFTERFDWNELVDALADVYIGFTFWSVLTSLGVLVWYFPLWHMGISGYEVAVMSTIGPLTLEIRSLRRLIGSILPYSNLGLMGLAGLLAFTITTPEYRLGAVSLAVWEGCAGCVGTWWRDRHEPAKFEARVMSWTIGLVASSVAKYAFWTNNPIWPVMNHTNGGWNTTGLLLFVLALVRIYTRRDVMAPPAGSWNQSDAPRPKGTSALAGLGFGGLMFGLHSLLSDSSTMVLWVWTGYPVEGPLPVPHGSWIHSAMVSGLIFGVFCPSLARSWTAFGVGSLGAAFVTLFDDWSGFYGGLVLGFYLCALTPVIIGNGVRFSPGRTFGFGFFVYNIMVLFHVWVVAYAFVPGGPLVREHTDWVMLTMMLLIGAGVFSAIANSSEGVQGPSSSDKRRAKNPAAKRNRSYYVYVLLILQLLSVSISYLRFPSYNYTPHHPDSKSITAGIWTIHFSIDNDMWSSERRMASLIRESELDVVGLLESDLQRIIMGNRDTTQYLAEELGMYVDQGPGPDQHTWGCALLSKFPIVNSTHHLLPSPVGELAPAIHATIDAYGTLVDVFVFHSGQEEDPEDRRLQTEYLSDLMGASTRPSILLSYLVVKPGEGNYNTWVSERSGMNDIDPSDWDRWCEYILYKGLRKTGYARLSRGTITDTELQVGKFVVGEPEGTGELIKEDQVPEDLRFPALFRGEGVRGHRYHVFDEPRYFA